MFLPGLCGLRAGGGLGFGHLVGGRCECIDRKREGCGGFGKEVVGIGRWGGSGVGLGNDGGWVDWDGLDGFDVGSMRGLTPSGDQGKV